MSIVDEDKVKVLIQDYIEEKVVFKRNCADRHVALEKSRDERGREIDRLELSIKDLTKCINGKLTKLFLAIIGSLCTAVITLVVVILQK